MIVLEPKSIGVRLESLQVRLPVDNLRRGCGEHLGVILATAGRFESQEEKEASDSETSESDNDASGIRGCCCRPRQAVRKSLRVREHARAPTPRRRRLGSWRST